MKSKTGGNHGERMSIFVFCLGHMRLLGRLFRRNESHVWQRGARVSCLAHETPWQTLLLKFGRAVSVFGREVSVCVLCFGHMRLFRRLFGRNVE